MIKTVETRAILYHSKDIKKIDIADICNRENKEIVAYGLCVYYKDESQLFIYKSKETFDKKLSEVIKAMNNQCSFLLEIE